MMGFTHAAGGAAVGAAVGAVTGHPVLGAVVGAAAGLMPDIDHPGSVIGQKIPVIPTLISVLAGHRGITHTVWFCFVLAGLTVLGAGSLGTYLPPGASVTLVLATLVGSLSHLTLDGLTRSGVSPFMPFPPHVAGPFSTGDIISELPVSMLLLAVCLYFLSV